MLTESVGPSLPLQDSVHQLIHSSVAHSGAVCRCDALAIARETYRCESMLCRNRAREDADTSCIFLPLDLQFTTWQQDSVLRRVIPALTFTIVAGFATLVLTLSPLFA